MRVWAENEEEARENVALNGWQILSIEESTFGQVYKPKKITRGENGEKLAEELTINITKIGDGNVEPTGEVKVPAGKDLKLTISPAPCEKVGRLIVNGQDAQAGGEFTLSAVSKDTSIVAVFEPNGDACAENGLNNDNLIEVATIYFNLGKFQTDIKQDISDKLTKLSKDKQYIIVGHTDDLVVQPNPQYNDNFQLSMRRAGFLNSKLVSMGIPLKNIKLMAMGPAFPAEKNMKEGQPLNRRAVIYERK